MPEGIRLEIDGRYRAMFSYKMKNYVLQDEAGKMTIRGSGLRSRGLERFQRRFMEEMFRLLLEDRRDEIPKLHDDYRARLARHEIGIADLMKTETLQDSLDTYRNKIGDNSRNLAAAYELALKAERPYLAGDQISYYVTGPARDASVNAFAKMAAEYDPDESRRKRRVLPVQARRPFRKIPDLRRAARPVRAGRGNRRQSGSALAVRRPASQTGRTECRTRGLKRWPRMPD